MSWLTCRSAEGFNLNIEANLKKRTDEALSDQLVHYSNIQDSRIQKKLCNLYGGWVQLAKPKDGYINLSDAALTDDQKELLNVGTNYVFMPKYSQETKKVELELLFQDVCKGQSRPARPAESREH